MTTGYQREKERLVAAGKSEAFMEGFVSGVLNENPYLDDDPRHEEWRRGQRAADDFEEYERSKRY